MNTTTSEKTAAPPSMSDYFVDIDLASMDIEKGAQILGQLVREIDGTDETNRIAYLASQLERHVQDLDEAVGKARRAVAPTSTTESAASTKPRTYLGDFESPLLELEGLAQTMLRASWVDSQIEVSSMNFLACRCHDLWRELRKAWERAWEAAGGEAANV